MPENRDQMTQALSLEETARQLAGILAQLDSRDRASVLRRAEALLVNPSARRPSGDPRIETLCTWGLISVRTRNAFVMGHRYQDKSGIEDIDPDELRLSHLASVSAGDLSRLPGFGRACYYELDAVMKRYGWSFGQSPLGRVAVPASYLEDAEAGRASAERDAARRRESHERDRAMTRLKDEKKLTYAQIGAQFGVSAAQAKTRIGVARSVEERRAADPLPDAGDRRTGR